MSFNKMHSFYITGPESSGKTMLAKSLATHYSCDWVPEYARRYLEELKRPYTLEDIEIIAHQQIELWEDAQKLSHNKQVLIMDTDLLVIEVWCEYVFQECPSWIQDQSKTQNGFWLLCKPDLPWEEDPLRENSHNRNHLFDLYLSKLEAYNMNYSIIEGQGHERLNKAIRAIDQEIR